MNPENKVELFERGTVADPMAAIEKIGQWLGGNFGIDNPKLGNIVALTCWTEKLNPIQFFKVYDIVAGKPRKKAMAGYAEFRARGGKVKWISTGEDGKEAKAEFTFEGQTVTLSHTIEQAKQADAIFKAGSNWVKTPGNMLRARLCSNAIGMLCPEIFAGCDDNDEVEMPALKLEVSTTPPSVMKLANNPDKSDKNAAAADAEQIAHADSKSEAESGLAPMSKAEKPKPEMVGERETLIEKIEGLMALQPDGKFCGYALQYLQANRTADGKLFLEKGQGWNDLSLENARLIVKKWDGFVKRVNGAVTGPKKA